MFPEVAVAVIAGSDGVDFRFADPVSIFMLVVSRNDEVVWELLANEGQTAESAFELVSMTPLEQATPRDVGDGASG